MTTPRKTDLHADKRAYIAHVLPRRVRLNAPLIASQTEVCRRIAERLIQTPGAHQKVSIRVMTGSIIVETQEGSIDAEALLARLRECLDAECEVCPPITSGPTKVARSVARAFAALNADVRGGLNHRADLAALMPVLLASVALVQVVSTGKLPAPAWFNLAWWSFRSFITFNMNAAKDDDESENPNTK